VSGETNLDRLLASMLPSQRPGTYVFVVADDPAALNLEVIASVVEAEGLSVVTTLEAARGAGLDYDFEAAWITLTVHSDLSAVGLTAAVSTALADAGISCNVIAGHFHDHLLVPEDRAHDALDLLKRLSARAAAQGSWGPNSDN
jgi:hypothetical protein